MSSSNSSRALKIGAVVAVVAATALVIRAHRQRPSTAAVQGEATTAQAEPTPVQTETSAPKIGDATVVPPLAKAPEIPKAVKQLSQPEKESEAPPQTKVEQTSETAATTPAPKPANAWADKAKPAKSWAAMAKSASAPAVNLPAVAAEEKSAPVISDAQMEELIDDLIYGGRAGDMDEIRAALAAGAPVDGRDRNGSTALMMAAANGHVEAIQVLLGAGASINLCNGYKNTALHWAVSTKQIEAVKVLLAADGVDLLIKNEFGLTAAMDAERAGKGEIVELILESLNDVEAAAVALGGGDAEEDAAALAALNVDEKEKEVKQADAVAQQAGVDNKKTKAEAPVAATGSKKSKKSSSKKSKKSSSKKAVAKVNAGPAVLITRERPLDDPEIRQRVEVSDASKTGDWRYSMMPEVISREKMLQFSQDFFATTELLSKDGNTFGAEFEQQYVGHKNYFYYMNRNQVVKGSEKAAFIFEELDAYTRQVVEHHHPGVPVRLERAFGAYYEGERDGFHLGVNEHSDGDTNLVSTVVHAAMPDGDVGFSRGGELTISQVDDMPANAIPHTNDTVGSVVYLGPSIFHQATPIKLGGKRLVFCMFYAAEDGTDLSHEKSKQANLF